MRGGEKRFLLTCKSGFPLINRVAFAVNAVIITDGRKKMKRGTFLIKSILAVSALCLMACATTQASKPKYKFANFGGSFEAAKQAGYDGIQLNHGRKSMEDSGGYTKEQIADLKKKMKDTGVVVCSVCVPCYHKFRFEDDKNVLTYMRNIIDQTAELGANDILIPFFGKSSLYEKEKVNGKFVLKKDRIEPLVKLLKELAPYARKKGVTLSLENTLTPEDNIAIIDKIGEPNVKVYFDTLNIVGAGYQPEDAIKILGTKYISQIHLKANKEFYDEATSPKDLNKCFQAIIDSGYDGWLVLEMGCKIKDHPYQEVITHNLKFFRNSVLGK